MTTNAKIQKALVNRFWKYTIHIFVLAYALKISNFTERICMEMDITGMKRRGNLFLYDHVFVILVEFSRIIVQ